MTELYFVKLQTQKDFNVPLFSANIIQKTDVSLYHCQWSKIICVVVCLLSHLIDSVAHIQ